MAATKLVQAVKAHIPLIKFPQRSKVLSYGSGQASSLEAVPAVKAAPSVSATSKPVGISARGSGIDFKDLPKRYQRKPLDQHEIDFITRGGPE